jgi:hypothetical protein
VLNMRVNFGKKSAPTASELVRLISSSRPKSGYSGKTILKTALKVVLTKQFERLHASGSGNMSR